MLNKNFNLIILNFPEWTLLSIKLFLKIKLNFDIIINFNFKLLNVLYFYMLKNFFYLYIYFFFNNYLKIRIKFTNEYKKNIYMKLNKKFKIFNKKKSYPIKSSSLINCFIWIIIFKKKNMFLTFLHYNGDVLFKSNLGSNNFKKRFKFTGVSIQTTIKKFSIKVKKILKKYKRKIIFKLISHFKFKFFFSKIRKKIKQFLINFLKKKIMFTKYKSIICYLLRNNLFKLKKFNKFNIIFNKIFLKKILKYILKSKDYLFILRYRNYKKFKKRIWLKNKKIILNIEIRSQFYYWVTKYLSRGFYKFFKKKSNINIKHCLSISHSKGFRIKKKRRL